ncbi:MAG: hypothetical protein U1E04_08530 [Hylemonella sp.]|nr:hypothetical protein [Hylemonella sp.]
MNTPQTPSIPPQKLDEMIQAMQLARDELLKVSLLLRDHLYETDIASRERARLATEALIRQCKPD